MNPSRRVLGTQSPRKNDRREEDATHGPATSGEDALLDLHEEATPGGRLLRDD